MMLKQVAYGCGKDMHVARSRYSSSGPSVLVPEHRHRQEDEDAYAVVAYGVMLDQFGVAVALESRPGCNMSYRRHSSVQPVPKRPQGPVSTGVYLLPKANHFVGSRIVYVNPS